MVAIQYDITATAEAEVIPGPLTRIRQLCEERMAEDGFGGLTDAATIWPSEILKIIDEGISS